MNIARRLAVLLVVAVMPLAAQPYGTIRSLEKKTGAPAVASQASRPQRAPDRILVKFKPSMRASAASTVQALSVRGLAMRGAIEPLNTAIVDVPSGKTPEQLIAEIRQDPSSPFADAIPDFLAYPQSLPNDPALSSQYWVTSTNLPGAWDSTSGSGVLIAILDTGIDLTHPDLASHISLTGAYDFGDGDSSPAEGFGHGTAVAGMAAAVGNNGVGVAGAAYSATILPIKITAGTAETSSLSAILSAITRAADYNARVVNLSFGSDSVCLADYLTDAASYLRARNGILVMSAGNESHDLNCTNQPDIVIVSAINSSNVLTSFSNFGPDIDVTAPGEDVLTTSCPTCPLTCTPACSYGYIDGTSFSSPLAAGILGLIFAVDPGFTPDQAKQILLDSADDLGAAGRDNLYGFGRVNATRAVSLAQERSLTFALNNLVNVYAYPNPWDARRGYAPQVTINNTPDGATVQVFTISGFFVKSLQPANGVAAWDLTTDKGHPAASGLYLYLVKTSGGKKARGKIALIR